MAKERYKQLLDKSVAAAISAIEIYNKPDFKYREETFSILMVNAWEVLFKAKILKDNKSNLNSIYVPEKTKSKDGAKLKRFYPKTNRCGNPTTIQIFEALERLDVDIRLKENIELLVEIRDNSIHLINKNPILDKTILEIGTANLKSFVTVVNKWFNYDLSQYNFYLMPISFFHTFELESFSINNSTSQSQNLLNYIAQREISLPSSPEHEHNISLKLITTFEKGSSIDALRFKYSEDAEISVKIDTESRFASKYTMSHEKLVSRLINRYSDFKQDRKFNQLKKLTSSDLRYSDERYLDYEKKAGSKKRYYSTEIFKEFDKYYTKKI